MIVLERLDEWQDQLRKEDAETIMLQRQGVVRPASWGGAAIDAAQHLELLARREVPVRRHSGSMVCC